jgi:hypothetical protein
MFSSNHYTDVKTPWQTLQKEVRFLRTASHESTSNTENDYLPVNLDSIQLWGDFMSHGEVRNMLDDPELQKVLFRDFTDDERAKLVMEAPANLGAGVQHTFDGLWPGIQNQLNLLQQMCAMSEQKTADPSFIVMSDGDCARKVEPVAVSKLGAKPDFASFKYIPGSNQLEGDGPNSIHNRIPGLSKSAMKIRRSMLPPDGQDYYRNRLAHGPGHQSPVVINQIQAYMQSQHDGTGYIINNERYISFDNPAEAQAIINQIHGFMHQHEARYGYIVNAEELIFFRRRGTGWGHLDISPAIRHDTKPTLDGTVLNSKLVLFYFHLVVANDDSQWRLT